MNVISVLDDFLYKENQDRGTRERDQKRLWPTDASAVTPEGKVIGKCGRQLWYKLRNYPEQPADARGLKIMTAGKIYEINEVGVAKRAGILQDNNIKFKFTVPGRDDITVSGEADVIYKDKDDPDKKIGGEIKSGYGYMFESFVFGTKYIPGMPKIEHVMQVLLYLYNYTRVDTSLGIDEFLITYINRGDCTKMSHSIKLSGDGIPIINNRRMVDIHMGNPKLFDQAAVGKYISRNETIHKKIKNYEFNIHSIFDRYATISDAAVNNQIPPADFKIAYSHDEIEDGYRKGDISKTKYTDYQKGKTASIGDWQCAYCSFRSKCIEDQGVHNVV